MRTLLSIFVLSFVFSCSTGSVNQSESGTEAKVQREFSRGEVILATQLLTKIFDREMGPIDCVPDHDEASLLLRTIRPRMELAQDDIEAMLDEAGQVEELVKRCPESCTCSYIDDLLREHQVALTKEQKKFIAQKKSEKETNRCMAFIQNTFCQSDLYRALDAEKSDFTFEEGAL